MNWHFTGLNDLYSGNGRGGMDFLDDRSWDTAVQAHKRAFRKYVPYYAMNYVFYPALAGPLWWKVLGGNWAAETLRDVYTAATIYCGHVGEDVARYPEGTRAKGKGHWYAMQVEAAHNFEVPKPVSVLCGALDRQIEHHLFPKLPPERLREVAPEVRRVCEAHGVSYRTGSWPRVLGRVLKRIGKLSHRDGANTSELVGALL
jgi:linoleoyl-CoA desaturase